MHDPLNAFALGGDVYIDGAKTGPLAGLTFAAKDVFDVAGYVTGAGNPDWRRLAEPAPHTAWAIASLLESGASLVGKTHTDELTRGIFGDNAHYGTPENPRAPGHVPGGSSSGSAAAVAGGLCNLALGTDTAGSTRVPASFCGIYGLRPTLGAIPMDGVLSQSDTFDTVGMLADDPEMLGRMAEVLLRKKIKDVRPAKVVVLEEAMEASDPDVAAAFVFAEDPFQKTLQEAGIKNIEDSDIEFVIATDSVPSRRPLDPGRFKIVSVAPLFAEVVTRFLA